jgi:uncharacterized membrane protein HdeD (DUF308 family)
LAWLSDLERLMAHAHSPPAHTDAWTVNWWQSILLGLVLVFAGLFMLRNAVAATVASAIVFGIVLLATGLVEVVMAFWEQRWGSLFWRLLLGALYAVAGAVLVSDPLAGSALLTLAFAAALIASGVARIYLAIRDWQTFGWLLLASGIIGILAGVVIVAKWPLSGLWVFGLVVGVDLVVHGLWWIASGWSVRHGTRPAA